MKNTKKKGFTLVELLVVIAIIAILAGVSIVGYLGFTEKAKESNAINELTQYKTVALANLADGTEKVTGDFTFTYTGNTLTVDKTATKEAVAELMGIKSTEASKITVAESKNIETIEYTLNGKTAVWTIADDKVEIKK